MQKKDDSIPLSAVLLMKDGKSVNKLYIEIIINEEIPISCINLNTNKSRLMPFKVLYDNNENFWQHSGGWEYFIDGEGLEKLKEKAIAMTGKWDFERLKLLKKAETKAEAKEEEEIEELEIEVGYGSDYNSFTKMTTEEKLERLNANKQKLNDLIVQKSRDVDEVMEALVDSTKDATLINHAVLEEALLLADEEAKQFTRALVDSTSEMVKSSTHLLTEGVLNNELMNTLVEKSNGTIVQHMTRVYLNGTAFLAYYNNLVSTSSAIQKLRISFAAKYREYYCHLLAHINKDDVNLERVFYGGMRAVPPDLFIKWSIGFLIHDIGKAEAIEYHEGESAYDRNTVIEHVKAGYKSIMTKTSYPMEASIITGYHHEYYGDPGGYGYFRAYLQQYKKNNPDAKQDYIITYELEPILDYKALAYFPAKVLEIIDVYDSVTDPLRVYRKPMQPEDALVMMREEFIEKNRKIDPIIFDIFVSFIHDKEKNKAA